MKRNKKFGEEKEDIKTFTVIATLFILSMMIGIWIALSMPKDRGEEEVKEVIARTAKDSMQTEVIETE